MPGRVPTGLFAEQWIGFSTDESERALSAKQVGYSVNRFPLLELGMSREHCQAVNRAAGFTAVEKSSCIGCPYRNNLSWRTMRDEQPGEFADAVDFDRSIRHGNARAVALGMPLRGQMFLHRSRVSLDLAPIDRVTSAEWASRQGDLVQLAELERFESEQQGCSPFSCPHEAA